MEDSAAAPEVDPAVVKDLEAVAPEVVVPVADPEEAEGVAVGDEAAVEDAGGIRTGAVLITASTRASATGGGRSPPIPAPCLSRFKIRP
jgi:hypothetical protein